MKTKATLFGFDGTPVKTYGIDVQTGTKDNCEKETVKLGHQIIIVDRSGSMWGDMGALKDTVIKVLTLNEFTDSDMLVSMISYSSSGDVTLHFERTPVSEVMKAGSSHLEEIRSIKATFLTCASQAMEIAEGLIDDDEITGIVLHSDGYTNDPSPAFESRSLDAICERLSKRDVFVNTIAYSDYSDFVLLSRVANSVSGTCVKANSTKEVFETLEESCTLLSKGSASPVPVDMKGSDYAVFMSNDPKKIIGTESYMSVKGVSESNHAVFRFTTVPEENIVPDKMTNTAMYGLARAKIAEGKINEAKMALLSSGNKTLAERHLKALTPSQLASMASDIEDALYKSRPSEYEFYQGTPSIDSSGANILDVINAMDKHKSDILLNVSKISSSYKKRGLRKVAGKREKDGTVTIPGVDTMDTSNTDFLRIDAFNANRDTATINMRVKKKIKLVKRGTTDAIEEVAGVLLDNLHDYRQYTVVGDGEVHLEKICVKFSTKSAFNAVADTGVLGDQEYSHTKEYEIDLSELPVCSLTGGGEISSDAFDKVARLNVMGRVIAALASSKSSEYTDEQIAELKKHYLSESMYLSIPMMNEHDDLDEAIKKGIVDTRTSYKITVGSTDILNIGKFKSANAFLDRMYEVFDKDGNKVSKPKLGDIFFSSDFTVDHKKISARTKITASDDFQKEIFDDLLGLEKTGELDSIGSLIGIDISSLGWRHEEDAEPDEEVLAQVVHDVKGVLSKAEEDVWKDISPVVFHIGSTGIIPDWLDSEAMTAEELTEKFPSLSLSKSEKEGTFFHVNGMIISVYASTSHFSTGKNSGETREKVPQVATA